MGTEMLDTQYASQLSGLPGGLSEAITRQLERQMGLSPGPIPQHRVGQQHAAAAGGAADSRRAFRRLGAAGFVQQHGDRRTRSRGRHRHPGRLHGGAGGARNRLGPQGNPPRRRHAGFQPLRHQGRRRLARAGGRGHDHRIRRRQGAEDGGEIPRLRQLRRVLRRLCAAHEGQPALPAAWWPGCRRWPRRTRTEAAAGFAQGLQRAGYATDPAYADKLGRVINTTLRLQRSLN